MRCAGRRRGHLSAKERKSKQTSKHESMKASEKTLTDITPNWSNIAGVVRPYQLVDEGDQVAEENPTNVEYSASVACSELRWGS